MGEHAYVELCDVSGSIGSGVYGIGAWVDTFSSQKPWRSVQKGTIRQNIDA